MSHYIPAFTEVNGRSQLSACNTWVREDEHSMEPTCETCKQYLADDCREISADQLFGAFDPLAVVKPSFHRNQVNNDRGRSSRS